MRRGLFSKERPSSYDRDHNFKDEHGNHDQQKQEETAFARIITSVHDFCMFMRDLYVPNDAILVPPVGGWSGITKGSFARLGKSDKVIEVLRHMTYIEDQHGNKYEFLPETGLFDYRDPRIINQIEKGDVEEVVLFTEGLDQHELFEDDELFDGYALSTEVGLTDVREGSEILWLDCETGTISYNGTNENPAGILERDDWCVEDFFEMVKDEFRTMWQLPKNDYQVVSMKLYNYEMEMLEKWPNAIKKEDCVKELTTMEVLKEVYAGHGWPDDFRKEDCAKELADKNEEERQRFIARSQG